MTFAVWQVGGPVFGIGETKESAFENALEWLDEETSEDDLFKGHVSGARDGDLVIIECSQEVAELIADYWVVASNFYADKHSGWRLVPAEIHLIPN